MSGEKFGFIGRVQGAVHVQHVNGAPEKADWGMRVYTGDLIAASADSSAEVQIDAGGKFTVEQSAVVRIDDLRTVTDVTQEVLMKSMNDLSETYKLMSQMQRSLQEVQMGIVRNIR